MLRKFEDKPKEALAKERFGMLTALAQELGSNREIVFPVSFDLSTRISNALRDERVSLKKIAQEIRKDPLVASKLLQLSNSATYNYSQTTISDIDVALSRVGLETARSVCMACAMAQMSKSSNTGAFADDRKRWLEHSLQTAGIARFLATRLTPKIDPGTALLAGLVHDLGAFFVLDRVARNEELVERPVSARFVVAQWHESVGAILLDALNMPEEIVEAVAEVDYPCPTIKQPRTLSDIVYVANLFAGGFSEFELMDFSDLTEPLELSLPIYTDLQEGMNAAALEMLQIG